MDKDKRQQLLSMINEEEESIDNNVFVNIFRLMKKIILI